MFLCILIGCLLLIFFLLFSGILKEYELAFYLAVEGHPAHLAQRVPGRCPTVLPDRGGNQVATLGPACPLHSDRCRWDNRCGWGAALLILIGSHVLSSNCLVRSSSAHTQVGKLGKKWQGWHGSGGRCFGGEAEERAREGKKVKNDLKEIFWSGRPQKM